MKLKYGKDREDTLVITDGVDYVWLERLRTAAAISARWQYFAKCDDVEIKEFGIDKITDWQPLS